MYIQDIDSRSELVPTLRLTAPEQWSQGCKYLGIVNNHFIITAVNILFTSGGGCKHLAILTFAVCRGSLYLVTFADAHVVCSVIMFFIKIFGPVYMYLCLFIYLCS